MSIHFGNEHFQFHKGVHAVYRVVINESWFYIGSSVDVKRRLSSWKHHLSVVGRTKNTSINFILPSIETVRFEVIEFVPENIEPKERENIYLKKYFGNPLCLNLVPDALTMKGRKLPLGVVRKEKRIKAPPTPKKPIAQFTLNGELIKIHESIAEASRCSGIKTDTIRKGFTNKRTVPRKFIFKPVQEDGSFLEVNCTPPLSEIIVRYIVSNYAVLGCAKLSRELGMRENYIRLIARGKVRTTVACDSYPEPMPQPQPKRVSAIGVNGEDLGEYESINKAAKFFKLGLRHVQDVLNGRRTHTKGYKFKYA